ncbi:tripartite tricarboxylate transporter TctB family protein [Allopusillimonas ginsengisoli]|uniref:tripartite tricarboxylate transporter TctB family protein n=1 Tax=Allopusillimonas ginsengisoli TaxID=453575 RepID=UPI0010213745|nr:tripartite tricarboxylate transporter TctB family protein [Allopusillimonas ginsengisoli]TEA74269.1 tripartite tricarboxylate transporter TctB family protein [Allopusillimonas ginsengisoli]
MTQETRPHERDVRGMIACLLFLLLGAGILWAAGNYSPLGAVFPRTIATLMMLLSLVYLIQCVRKPRRVEHETGGSGIRRLLMFLIMLIWAFSFEHIGFLTTSVVCFALALLVGNYDKWTPRTMLVYSASGLLVIGVLYVLFKEILQVPLPVGLLL